MEMFENCQNTADCSGVCRCQITTYDKQIGSTTGALTADKTPKSQLI